LKSILSEQQLTITIKRLAHQVLENHPDLADTVLIGLQPRGVFLSDRIVEEIARQVDAEKIRYGKLDITFYRDDIRKEEVGEAAVAALAGPLRHVGGNPTRG